MFSSVAVFVCYSLNTLLFGRNIQEDVSTDAEMPNDKQSAGVDLSSEKAEATVTVRILSN